MLGCGNPSGWINHGPGAVEQETDRYARNTQEEERPRKEPPVDRTLERIQEEGTNAVKSEDVLYAHEASYQQGCGGRQLLESPARACDPSVGGMDIPLEEPTGPSFQKDTAIEISFLIACLPTP